MNDPNEKKVAGGRTCDDDCSKTGNDSSYDSDVSETGVGTGTGVQHEDVSRTSSDTLAAEHSESKEPDECKLHYEFGLKLGYSKSLISLAVEKLGTKCEQNELLAELIRLSAGSRRQPVRRTSTDIGGDHDNDDDNDEGSNLHLKLRPIVIDGSNVAMSHGNKEVFSCRGLKLCVDWFLERGHREITVFVPKWRRESPRFDNPICDREILDELEQKRLLVFTPSRHVNGKRLVCYDDRYVLRLAADTNAIVVSNDNYRDLAAESVDFRDVIEKRILMYSFVNDKFMPPEDPLGRSGPSLAIFLSFAPSNFGSGPCPYGRKCTYGQKCKFSHAAATANKNRELKTLSLPLAGCAKKPLCLSKSQPEPFLHKRLQRQLTLNPVNDPRLQNLYGHQLSSSSSVSSSSSYQLNRADSSRTLFQQPHPFPLQPMNTQLGQQHQFGDDAFHDARYKLKFHLNALFPPDQVQHVMNLYPDELSAQKLCAAILMLFPPNV